MCATQFKVMETSRWAMQWDTSAYVTALYFCFRSVSRWHTSRYILLRPTFWPSPREIISPYSPSRDHTKWTNTNDLKDTRYPLITYSIVTVTVESDNGFIRSLSFKPIYKIKYMYMNQACSQGYSRTHGSTLNSKIEKKINGLK